MNRRGFLGTLAALIAAVTAKVKGGPSVPAELVTTTHPAWRPTPTPAQIRAKLVNAEMNALMSSMNAPWPSGTRLSYMRTKDGLYRWVSIDKD